MADLKHANKLYKEKIAEEKRVAREAAKVEREKEKAEKAAGIAERRAERERQKQAHEAEKSIQSPNQVRRKVSRQLQPKITKKRGGRGNRSRAVDAPRSPSPPPIYNSRGRKIAPRKNFEAEI